MPERGWGPVSLGWQEARPLFAPAHLRHYEALRRCQRLQLAANMGTSVEMLENFYGKKRMRDPKSATEVTKHRSTQKAEGPAGQDY